MPLIIPVFIAAAPWGKENWKEDCVTCPWHNWEYNVKTGACLTNPSAKVKSYDVKVEGTDIQVLLE